MAASLDPQEQTFLHAQAAQYRSADESLAEAAGVAHMLPKQVIFEGERVAFELNNCASCGSFQRS